MISDLLFIIGAVIVILWGAAHITPVKQIVNGFGEISRENRLILIMEWVAEGLAICFPGILVLVVTAAGYAADGAGRITIYLSAAMLLVLAALTLFTGARTSIIPIKLCPAVKTAAAALWVIGCLI